MSLAAAVLALALSTSVPVLAETSDTPAPRDPASSSLVERGVLVRVEVTPLPESCPSCGGEDLAGTGGDFALAVALGALAVATVGIGTTVLVAERRRRVPG